MFSLPRTPSMFLRRVSPGLALLILALSPRPALFAQAQTDLKVEYTGKLFGYYRIEPDERIRSTPTEPTNITLAPVRTFLDSLSLDSLSKDPRHPDTLLLGMGDNFAPEFGASIQQELRLPANGPSGSPAWAPCYAAVDTPGSDDSRQWHLSAPEALYKSRSRLPVLADCDNVTRFLIAAGYRAIVPGREDFIYSATWLRRIGFLLKGGSATGRANPFTDSGRWTFDSTLRPERSLHLLAANIRVKASGSSCPLLFADDLTSRDHPCLESDNTVTAEMDWFRRLQQTLDSYAVEDSLVRQAAHDANFRMQTVINQVHILSTLLDGYKCSVKDLAEFSASAAYRLDEANGVLSLVSSAQSHLAGTREAVSKIVCHLDGQSDAQAKQSTILLRNIGAGVLDAVSAATGPVTPITTILVSQELRRQAVDLLLNLIYAEQKDIGFTIAQLPSGKHSLIIGVAGQETMQQISQLNFKVYPDRKNCATPNPGPGNIGCGPGSPARDKSFPLAVGDPHFAVTAVLRAAWAERARERKENPEEGRPLFDTVIVMAQMPSTEAEELAERVRADIQTSFATPANPKNTDRPSIDLVLSEAQYGRETPTLSIRIEPGTIAPVLVPPDASSRLESKSETSISAAVLSDSPSRQDTTLSRSLVNTLPPEELRPTGSASLSDIAALNSDPACETAACLLKEELHKASIRKQSNSIPPTAANDTDLDALWNSCKVDVPNGRQYNDRACQNNVLMQYLLRQLQRSSRTDVALLERRDFYFDWLGDQYGDYSVCNRWDREVADGGYRGQTMPKQYQSFYLDYCRLMVALDRVLWKGDYSERVMVDGNTLAGLMQAAAKQTDQEQTLLARDLHQEWLMTFGIVTKPSTNLVTAASGPDNFSVPGSDGCANGTGAAAASPGPYCVNGQSILSDHAYWVVTSDQLAQDTSVYSALGSLTAKPNHYASSTDLPFLTSEIADNIFRRGQPAELSEVTTPASRAGKSELRDPAEANLATMGMIHQDRNLLQLDFTKLAAGYTFTSPSLSDNALAADLSGVSNTQAVIPHSQELDLEAASRLTSAPLREWFVVGAQSDAEYDRKVTGNLTGNPETVTYAANSYTVGGFTEVSLHSRFIPGLARSGINRSTRNLPRAFLVLSPYQYQRQMTGAFLNFAFFTPPNTSNSQQQRTIQVPTATSFSQRAGLRYEFGGIWKSMPDSGSYFEIGPEYSVQHNVLSAIDLPQLSPSASCDVVATQSLQTCVKSAYKAAGATLNAASTLVPVTQTLHTGGFYWTAHLQKVLDKQKNYSASFDTQGDSFLLPGATLTTQTRYAFSTKLALNFKIAGNLSLSPTYSDYFFENQGPSSQRTNVIASTFTISAKWYFARDAEVPFRKQIWFVGPATTDQTASAKIK